MCHPLDPHHLPIMESHGAGHRVAKARHSHRIAPLLLLVPLAGASPVEAAAITEAVPLSSWPLSMR